MQLTKPNSNNNHTETNNIVPATIATKTAPLSLNQSISNPASDDKIDTDVNSDDENENIPINQKT